MDIPASTSTLAAWGLFLGVVVIAIGVGVLAVADVPRRARRRIAAMRRDRHNDQPPPGS
jgi:hypothetical protein